MALNSTHIYFCPLLICFLLYKRQNFWQFRSLWQNNVSFAKALKIWRSNLSLWVPKVRQGLHSSYKVFLNLDGFSIRLLTLCLGQNMSGIVSWTHAAAAQNLTYCHAKPLLLPCCTFTTAMRCTFTTATLKVWLLPRWTFTTATLKACLLPRWKLVYCHAKPSLLPRWKLDYCHSKPSLLPRWTSTDYCPTQRWTSV